jgi:hypothetical protein
MNRENVDAPMRPQPPWTVTHGDEQAETYIGSGQKDGQQSDVSG